MATLDSLGMDFSTQPTCVSGVAPSRRYWAGLTAALRPSLSSVGSVRPMRSCPEPRATQRPKQTRPPLRRAVTGPALPTRGRRQLGHAGHPLERTERPERTEGADDGIVAHRGEEDGCPRERDDHKVELAPRVAQVRLAVPKEAVGEHLGQELDGEDAQVDLLARVDLRVERDSSQGRPLRLRQVPVPQPLIAAWPLLRIAERHPRATTGCARSADCLPQEGHFQHAGRRSPTSKCPRDAASRRGETPTPSWRSWPQS